MSEKHANFHRIATNRVDVIVDTFRKIANLSGPNYEWSPEEVMSYFAQVDAAKDAALARFHETKRWRTAAPEAAESSEPAPETDLAAQDEPSEALSSPEAAHSSTGEEPVTKPAERAAPSKTGHPRNLTIAQILTECEDDREMLAEMVRLQRMMIYEQSARLGEKVTYPVPQAAE